MAEPHEQGPFSLREEELPEQRHHDDTQEGHIGGSVDGHDEVDQQEARQAELLLRIERLERRDLDTRAHVLDHEQRMERVESRQTSLQDAFRSLKGDVAAVSAETDDAGERLDDLESRVERIESESWATQVWGN